jgi:hypothetical protein
MNQRADLEWIGPCAWLKNHHMMEKLCWGNPVLAIFTVGKTSTFDIL